ncbi:MAG: hypothetical protein HC767_09035 [Akkermansiaceae bacterium]|nr:hypothetical protein [Akkermansiaceae bacterium]
MSSFFIRGAHASSVLFPASCREFFESRIRFALRGMAFHHRSAEMVLPTNSPCGEMIKFSRALP